MALATNQRLQMAKRLQQSLQYLAPEYVSSLSADAAGNPAIQVQDPANSMANVAVLDISPKQFNGFQMLAELSSSSAQGLPESDLFLVVLDNCPVDKMAKITKAACQIGASSLKVCVMPHSSHPALTIADAADANLTVEIPNDDRVGFSGN